MSLFSALVVYAVLWFLTLFLVLPLRLTTQREAGQVVPGTPGSAPENPQIRKRMLITTAVSFVLWVVIVGVIISEVVGVEDMDFLYRATRG